MAFAVLPCVAVPQAANAGSLWREAVTDERGMYADKKARRIGDIVTVEVNEAIVLTNTKTFGRDRSAESTGPIGLGTQLVNSLVNSVSSRQASTAAGDPVRRKFPLNLLPKSTADSEKSKIFDPAPLTSNTESSGNATNRQVLQFQMAVQVIDTLPNGIW
jgi:flagellar basal body L-ring protein FlgH